MATDDQQQYGNTFERSVIDRAVDPEKYPREIARYQHAARYIKPGDAVIDLGCSSGFGAAILPPGINYVGIDYDEKIINYARSQFGDESHRFEHATIDEFLASTKFVNVIIAYEVLEHVKNGKELAQELKKHCSTLLISAPYKEPPGTWGMHHVLHDLSERDFPGFEYRFMNYTGDLKENPEFYLGEMFNKHGTDVMMMRWQEGEVFPKRPRVLCAIPTKNRYEPLLRCLQSIAFQTFRPDRVVIYDDSSPREDIREHPSGRHVFPLLFHLGIEWEVVFTPGQGQHVGHQISNTTPGFDYVWRLDDDSVAKPDVLERLLAHMKPDVGGVGGAVYEPGKPIFGGVSKLGNFFENRNLQWGPDQGVHEVDFLYSSFLYRPGIVNYKFNMSPVAYHEESIFSHRLKLAGYKLIVDTSIETYHLKCPVGGCRDQDYRWAYAWDQSEFLKIMSEEWRVKLISMRSGLGDCLAFKNIIPELLQRYETLIIGSCYPEVFENIPRTHVIHYEVTRTIQDDNVYAWMAEKNWKGTLIEGFRKMFLGA